MSLWVSAGVAGVYAGAMVGIHRARVWRQRRQSQGFQSLARLDWDFVLGPLEEVQRREARAGGDPRRWISLLPGESVQRLVLEEHLRLRAANALSLEWVVFPSKAVLRAALARHGQLPALYFTRAFASSLVGFNTRAIDDLARAVYYSRQAPFYVRAVVDAPFIREQRPALYRECEALAARDDKSPVR